MSRHVTAEIKRLIAAFPRQAIPAETQAVYIDALGEMPPEALRLAVDLVIRSDDWFPTIKRLRTACEDFTYGQLSAAENGRWIKWWLSRAPNGYDPVSGFIYKPTEWPNAVCEEAARLMGWSRICQSEERYFDRDWEKAWNDAKGLVLKRAALDGPVGDALGTGSQPENVRQIKAVS